MDDEAADVADVGDVAVQLQRLDEPLTGLAPALDHEREHAAVALAARRTSSPARATGSTRGRRSATALDLVAPDEELGHRVGVLEVPLHAQAQRLEALEEQERVERRSGAPRSRSSWTRALMMNAPGPSAGQ